MLDPSLNVYLLLIYTHSSDLKTLKMKWFWWRQTWYLLLGKTSWPPGLKEGFTKDLPVLCETA